MAEYSSDRRDEKPVEKPAEEKASETPNRDKARRDRKEHDERFGPGVVHGGDSYEAVPPEEDPDAGDEIPSGRPADGVFVTVHNRRHGGDLLQGQWCKVVAGEHKGREGVLLKPVAFGKDKYPSKWLVRTDDDEHQQLVLLASSLKHKESVR